MRQNQLTDLLTEEYISTNGVRLHCMSAGTGELIVLLHGFPEHWYSWRHQIPMLAEHGRVLAPDLRGYNLSDKPRGVKNYDIDILAADIKGLIKQAGAQNAIVIGHDWGGAVAWWLAIYHPDVVKKLVIMNAPHPFAFQRLLLTFDQLHRSWYMFFFQLPWLPEKFVHGGNARNTAIKTFRGTAVRKDAFTDQEIDQLAAALDQPGAITAMLNYYRAAFRRSPFVKPVPPITLPTQVIWGEKDQFLVRKNTEMLDRWVKNLRVDYVSTAAHWVQQEEPEIVNRLLADFLFN